MSSLPSVRECLQRLDRMRDTGQVIEDLRELDCDFQTVDDGASAAVIAAAVDRLGALHQLCLHMAANLNGGLGVPPTPATREAKSQPKPHVATPSAPAAAPVQIRSYYTPPPGMCTRDQAIERLGVSNAYFARMVVAGIYPRPHAGGGKGKPAFYRIDAIDELAAQRKRRRAIDEEANT